MTACGAVKDYGCVEKEVTTSEEASKLTIAQAGVLWNVRREINGYSEAAIRRATKGN